MSLKYVTKPVTVDAVIWTGVNRNEIWQVCTLCYFNTDLDSGDLKLMVQTGTEVVEANVGDYVVKDKYDIHSVYTPAKFLEKYDKA
jgi:molybdenum cofactor biosynthesis enzyme MoaA